MIDKRLLFALPAVMLLAGCGGDAPATDGGAASGEVLEGTISDEMLPVDRVRSEPPLEDPEAFAKVRSPAEGAGEGDRAGADEGGDEGDEGDEGGTPAAEVTQPPTPDVAPDE